MLDLIISQYLDGSDIANAFHELKEILVEGLLSSPTIKSNPREIKRALNKIIIASKIYDVPIDILVVVSSLVSRPKWNKFVEFIIMNDDRRYKFLNRYLKLISISDHSYKQQRKRTVVSMWT
jgi:hypothetical protein